jgi:hypothetical protein
VKRSWSLAAFVVACTIVAVVVAWWPREHTTVRIESADASGVCLRDLATDRQECLEYTPEFPSEARYREGECLRLTRVYRGEVPPHAERVRCPA